MTVNEILNVFNFTESHINHIEIKSKYGTTKMHIDSMPYILKDIKEAEVSEVSTINRPCGYYTEQFLIIKIRI